MNKKKAFEVICLVVAAIASARLINHGSWKLGLLGYLCVSVYIFNRGEGEI